MDEVLILTEVNRKNTFFTRRAMHNVMHIICVADMTPLCFGDITVLYFNAQLSEFIHNIFPHLSASMRHRGI